MSQRQDIGLALSQLTYDTLTELLRTRLNERGRQKATKNGPMFSVSHYALFWNKHVVKEGEYFKIKGGVRKQLPDLVFCDYKLFHGQRGYPDKTAILAIELKNYNLDYKWPSTEQFDKEVMTRFLWTPDVQSTLRRDVGGWEKYAEQENLFPNAVKVLIIPKFAFLQKTTEVRPWWDSEKLYREIAVELGQPLGDEVALENSDKGWIEWRIKRLKLHIDELGFQPHPDRTTPDEAKARLRGVLNQYLNQLRIGTS